MSTWCLLVSFFGTAICVIMLLGFAVYSAFRLLNKLREAKAFTVTHARSSFHLRQEIKGLDGTRWRILHVLIPLVVIGSLMIGIGLLGPMLYATYVGYLVYISAYHLVELWVLQVDNIYRMRAVISLLSSV